MLLSTTLMKTGDQTFLSPVTQTTDCTPFYTQRQAIRELVAASLQVVNLNGGWDVIGWCHRGEVADALANQEAGNKVANVNQPENSKNFKDTGLYTIVIPSTSLHPNPLERRYKGYSNYHG
jgi:hypothetical protein